VNGTGLLYADRVTPSMKAAMDLTNERRERQQAFNEANGIVPRTIQRRIFWVEQAEDAAKRIGADSAEALKKTMEDPREAGRLIEKLKREMQEAARKLDFETAAEIRDRIRALRAVMGNG